MRFRESNPARLLSQNRLLLIALGIVLIFHGALLPFSVGNTYDAYIHMFFGDSYARSWFDPWEPRWYTGFATTSYPPGTHMGIALFSKIFGLIGGFIAVMLIGLCTLTLGVYRFCLLFVNFRAAGYAAIFAVVSTSVVETVHIFGQLPTIFSLGLFLNGLPHVYRWLVTGQVSQFVLAVLFGAATTAAHHVTTIFGTLLFIGPVGLYAWIAFLDLKPEWRNTALSKWKRALLCIKPLIRGVILGVFLVGGIVITVFAYWYWSVTDPITQVSIPHGSRENFLEKTGLGLVFFLIPWGIQLLVLPYVAYKSITSRMWPIGMMVFICFVLGTGGTTPIPKLILGPAFDILTLDRFTFWATILILPFTGLKIESLLHGQLGKFIAYRYGRKIYSASVVSFALVAVCGSILTATLSTFRPTQPDKIDPAPIVKFMNEDQHDRWRYLTLGFGDQFAYISAQIDARSVDGNYHSARRLPELVSYAVERLENSKYLGVAGLGSLQQFLVNSDRYHLKFIFSNDQFYDPLLHFTGWNRLLRLSNGIVVWEKPDVAPLPAIEPRRNFPQIHTLMWGCLPPLALILGYLCLIGTTVFRGAGIMPDKYKISTQSKPLSPRANRYIFAVSLFAVILTIPGLLGWGWSIYRENTSQLKPMEVLERYYTHLDFREFDKAYDLLAPDPSLDFETFMLNQRWVGGMLASYAKLTEFDARREWGDADSEDWIVTGEFLTPFDVSTKSFNHRLVQVNGEWRITFEPIIDFKPTERFQSAASVSWNRPGRRAPLKEDVHRDILDRPKVSVTDAQLVFYDDKYRLVGMVRNDDVDPAAIKSVGFLKDGSDRTLVRQQAGSIASHRLLPGQTGWFSIEFEGVLSLADAESRDVFDPKLFIPPEFDAQPVKADLSVQAVVNESNHYQGVTTTITDIKTQNQKTEIAILLTNSGTEQVEIAQIQYVLFEKNNRVVAVEQLFSEKDLKPGQSRALKITLPRRQKIKTIYRLNDQNVMANKRTGDKFAQRVQPRFLPGFVPLVPESGYSGIAINIQTMNFFPLF
ncbi:MAG: hypothetical protein AAF217_08980 [Pseudomonadota bacterium]